VGSATRLFDGRIQILQAAISTCQANRTGAKAIWEGSQIGFSRNIVEATGGKWRTRESRPRQIQSATPMTPSPLTEPMPVLLFLEGRGTDGAGRFIEEILSFDEAALERNHDFIQWLFPLPEPSRAQPQSPILSAEEIRAIRTSAEAQSNLDRATRRPSVVQWLYSRTTWRRTYCRRDGTPPPAPAAASVGQGCRRRYRDDAPAGMGRNGPPAASRP
jgi:hypothetical protein